MVRWTLNLCAILMAALLLIGAVRGFAENRRFSDHAQKALAEPIQQYTETTTVKKKLFVKISESKSYASKIYFTTADNRRIEVNKNLSEELLELFRDGEKVFIEYLPEDPTMTRFPGEGPRPFLSLLLALAVLGVAYFFWRRKDAFEEEST
jgi:hypothetical protein